MNKKTIIFSIIIILAIAGATAFLFVSGKLVWAGQKTQLTTTKIVCDSQLVSKFNDALYFIGRGGSSTYTVDEVGVKSIKTEIQGLNGYENDPTCQTILYLIAIYEEDYAGSKTAYEAVKALHSKNLYADSNIRGNQPLFMYEPSVFALSEEGKSQGGIGGE